MERKNTLKQKPASMIKTKGKLYKKFWVERPEMKTYGPVSRHTRQILFKFLRTTRFNSVIDVGCGVGKLLNEIKSEYPKTKICGIEYTKNSIDIAKKNVPNAKFYCLDITKNALNKKFDLVLCIDVLEHIKEDIKAIKNLRKMTKKYLLIAVPTGTLFEVEKNRVGHVHGYSHQEINKKLNRGGFKIIKSLQWGFPFYNMYRRLMHHMPARVSLGTFNSRKKLISQVAYWILKLNIATF